MKIAIANDHAAIELKKEILMLLDEMGIEYINFGTDDTKSVDYPVYSQKAAMSVASGECDLGIVMCGTGIGVSLAANKVKGIRCALCSEPYSAKMAREHNNANMLAMGARVLGVELAKMTAKTFLQTEFLAGRHNRRVELISRIEEGETL
ncbi:MAG: ribose 5-phosphate isomerase B [Eubacteriales bacterium]|nr:ribose 5-phosphate isomerase B [Eubacteriales bacterium]